MAFPYQCTAKDLAQLGDGDGSYACYFTDGAHDHSRLVYSMASNVMQAHLAAGLCAFMNTNPYGYLFSCHPVATLANPGALGVVIFLDGGHERHVDMFTRCEPFAARRRGVLTELCDRGSGVDCEWRIIHSPAVPLTGPVRAARINAVARSHDLVSVRLPSQATMDRRIRVIYPLGPAGDFDVCRAMSHLIDTDGMVDQPDPHSRRMTVVICQADKGSGGFFLCSLFQRLLLVVNHDPNAAAIAASFSFAPYTNTDTRFVPAHVNTGMKLTFNALAFQWAFVHVRPHSVLKQQQWDIWMSVPVVHATTVLSHAAMKAMHLS
jgi:hypothetical protein